MGTVYRTIRLQQGSIKTAYGQVLRIASELGDRYLDPFRVKLVGLSEKLVQAAAELCKGQPPKIPLRFGARNLGGTDIEEVLFLRGPKGEYTMSTGREMLDQIIDQEASFFELHGQPPRKIKLPVLMAYDLAKCGREELGELSGRVFKDGISVFEKEGLHGMAVEIVRDRNAVLQLE